MQFLILNLIQDYLKTGVTSHLSLSINPLHLLSVGPWCATFAIVTVNESWVYAAYFTSGCVRHVILSYNAHALTLLL